MKRKDQTRLQCYLKLNRVQSGLSQEYNTGCVLYVLFFILLCTMLWQYVPKYVMLIKQYELN